MEVTQYQAGLLLWQEDKRKALTYLVPAVLDGDALSKEFLVQQGVALSEVSIPTDNSHIYRKVSETLLSMLTDFEGEPYEDLVNQLSTLDCSEVLQVAYKEVAKLYTQYLTENLEGVVVGFKSMSEDTITGVMDNLSIAFMKGLTLEQYVCEEHHLQSPTYESKGRGRLSDYVDELLTEIRGSSFIDDAVFTALREYREHPLNKLVSEANRRYTLEEA
jgi:hypothetical protein